MITTSPVMSSSFLCVLFDITNNLGNSLYKKVDFPFRRFGVLKRKGNARLLNGSLLLMVAFFLIVNMRMYGITQRRDRIVSQPNNSGLGHTYAVDLTWNRIGGRGLDFFLVYRKTVWVILPVKDFFQGKQKALVLNLNCYPSMHWLTLRRLRS